MKATWLDYVQGDFFKLDTDFISEPHLITSMLSYQGLPTG